MKIGYYLGLLLCYLYGKIKHITSFSWLKLIYHHNFTRVYSLNSESRSEKYITI